MAPWVPPAASCKKLAAFAVVSGAAVSHAAEAQAGLCRLVDRCEQQLPSPSPFRIRNVILKNRIMHTISPPHSMQGPENYPTDVYRNHYSNMAKNAAIVSLDTHFASYPIVYKDQSDTHNRTDHFSDHSWQDIPPVHNYLNRMIDDIHIEGALVFYGGGTGGGPGGGGGAPGGGGGAPGGAGGPGGGGAPGGAAGGQGGQPQGAAGAQGGGPGGGAPGGAGGPGGAAAAQGAAARQAGAPGGAGGPGGGGGQGGPGGPRQTQDTRTVKEIVNDAKDIESQGYDVYELSSTKPEAVEAVRNATNLILMTKMRVGSQGQQMGATGPTTNLHNWVYEGSDLDWPFGKSSPGLGDNKPTKNELDEAVETAKKARGSDRHRMAPRRP